MTFLAIPSFIALLIKAILFAVARGALFKKNVGLALFLVALFFLNLAEFMLFVYIEDALISLISMKAYYVAAVFTAATFFALALQLTFKYQKYTTSALLAVSMVISGFIVAGNELIAGTNLLSYSITADKGSYYWVIQSFVIGSTLLGLVALIWNSIKSRKSLSRQRSTVVLLSTAPMALFTVFVIVMMAMGYHMNATVVQSLLSSLLLAILIYTEARYRLFMFLSYVPYTREHSIRAKATGLVNQAITDLFDEDKKLPLKDIRAEFETTLIKLAIESTDGNKTQAAKALGIGKATLHRKIEGLEI